MMHGALFGPNEPQQAAKAQVKYYFNLNDVDSAGGLLISRDTWVKSTHTVINK